MAMLAGPGAPESMAQADLESPRYGPSFWSIWSDGQSEISAYELRIRRYGEWRDGVAVTIFVHETFSEEARVKADPGKHTKQDEYPVLKLNLIVDFQTGIYDYNVMTSSFVTLAPRHGRGAGFPTKLSFSSQEWCGHVYHQAIFEKESIELVSHSYFDGEADGRKTLDYPGNGISEDALLFWARGLAAPALEPGQTVEVPLLRSLQEARLSHRPLEWRPATLSRAPGASSVEVPAGSFEVEVYTARIQGGATWEFFVEKAAPHRIVRWTSTDGQEAVLLGSRRSQYWRQNSEGFESELEKIGLKRRPPRSP
jgi:hypothetical protein